MTAVNVGRRDSRSMSARHVRLCVAGFIAFNANVKLLPRKRKFDATTTGPRDLRPTILKPSLRDTTCCQTGLTTGWTTGCIVYTNIQPVVVKPVVQPV